MDIKTKIFRSKTPEFQQNTMKNNNTILLFKNFIVFPFLLLSFCSIAFLFTPSLLSMNGGEETPKNVLLITIDTLRTDRLSCYGNTSFKTPNIDSLAERGVRYRRAFAHNSLTLPSHTNILLGTTPLFHEVQDNSNFKVRKNFLTLAELLKGIGYSTGAFIGGAPLDSLFGFERASMFMMTIFHLPALQNRYTQKEERTKSWTKP